MGLFCGAKSGFPEELNLSTPAALFQSRPGYSRLSGKGPGAGGPIRTDTVRGLGPSPLPIGLRQPGAPSRIRTDTARSLKPPPPDASCQLGYARQWRTVEGSNLRTLAGSAR